ncbi:Phosphate transport system permease protein PstA [Methylacidimicrobium sp. AP8]|uniref:phosphate ABC transporter permease PstA n=1 Tax=Methylacidimicrobium sp. AP8 TaxID=2730359 RepID=UPI0018BFFBCD|nr:phosphate ABC transporter permease PstA [Methylacidimicrobium sp. AP8]CAB4242660.1 Phosphate transport system permease protein PstA [Methylacidimicrobium sp. AP8]
MSASTSDSGPKPVPADRGSRQRRAEARRFHFRKAVDRFFRILSLLAAVTVLSPLVLVLIFLLSSGGASLTWDFLTQLPKPVGEAGGGMANAIAGSCLLVALATVIAAPIGVLGGVFLLGHKEPRLRAAVRLTADVLNGVPSIIWGIVVYSWVVLRMKTFSGLAGGLALAFIMIPLILRTTEDTLRLVPPAYYEAGLALGLRKSQILPHIVLAIARRGIVAGVLLSAARAAGETAPLLFTAFGNRVWTTRLQEPMAALPLQIFTYAISPYPDWHSQAWAGALVLFALVFLMNVVVRLLYRGK